MIDAELWKRRQELHYKARSFFLERGLLEADVPILSSACSTDPHIDYFETAAPERYLSTSPEFFMKRLLANGFGDCFALARAFRKDESGARHNSEFNIAEWYRVGFSAEEMQEEILSLVNEVTGFGLRLKRTAWEEAFEGVDIERLMSEHEGWALEDAEDYAMASIIEPGLGRGCAEFIVDYPPGRAALAKIGNADGREVAQRFELYVNGIELCNGYCELIDAAEQRKRFCEDLEARRRMGKPIPRIDENFLAALEKGMPECSGAALGLDRLYMLALGKSCIDEVLLFGDSEA